jgi:hypothetical protein
MLNLTQLKIDAFVDRLREGYLQTFGRQHPEYPEILAWAGAMAIENIARSDALYHDVDHTILVTLVGQEILKGRHIREGGVTPGDWLHVVVSLVCHDIGYVHGVCRGDRERECATGRGDEVVEFPEGATDAFLTRYHVDRGQRFVEERFGTQKLIDAGQVKRNIERTRFPVPADEDPRDTAGYPSLIRSADLIGQLGDPRYLRRIPALFGEFEETGVNRQLGYASPADLKRNYPAFYWKQVHPYVREAIRYLEATQEGQQVRAQLFANVFTVEHAVDGDEARPGLAASPR